MIKKTGMLGLLALAMLTACKDTTKFTISGKFKNTDAQHKVYLYAMSKTMSMDVVDSTNVSSNGEFTFTSANPEADFYRVNYNTNDYILIAKNGDKVVIEADVKDKELKYSISGGEDANKIGEFIKIKDEYQAKLAAINNDFKKKLEATPDKRNELMNELSPIYTKTLQEMNQAISKFAMDNSKSLASFYAISLIDPMGNDKILIDYVDKLDAGMKKNPMIKSFADNLDKLRKVQIGQTAPDFSMPSIVDGKTIKLADYRGKYVLIDFWASWCAPCRQENPNVVKAYNNFKNRNFTVLGISLDKDKANWINAVKQDNLLWDQGSELNDFASATAVLYNIQAIPSSFLLDPQGKIIARDLRGKDLEDFLEKTLPKS